jgi:GntR family transcriptional repressor for pyruvate dehydrogenase complex
LGLICDRYDEVCSRLFALPDLEDPDILEELIEKDLDFHHEIIKLSKNTLYSYSFEVAREPIFRYLHIILTHRIDNSVDRRDLLARACAQHRSIFQAIRDKDPETCRKAILEMIDYTTEF